MLVGGMKVGYGPLAAVGAPAAAVGLGAWGAGLAQALSNASVEPINSPPAATRMKPRRLIEPRPPDVSFGIYVCIYERFPLLRLRRAQRQSTRTRPTRG